eukprot:Selendium_serpulae@DN5198_c0_g1_i10.p1
MELIIDGYDDDSDGKELSSRTTDDNKKTPKRPFELMRIESNPDVDTFQITSVTVDPSTKLLTTNPSAKTLYGPMQGPVQPHVASTGGIEKALQNHATGTLETVHIRHTAFDTQYNIFNARGVAVDPSDIQKPLLKRDAENGQDSKLTAATVSLAGQGNESDWEKAQFPTRSDGKKRVKCGGASSEEFLGPWAPFVSEIERKQEMERNQSLADAEAATADSGADKGKAAEKPVITSVFHGHQERNSLGVSWIDTPKDYKARDEGTVNYIPKKHTHTYVGHTMAVFAVRYFPGSGHLLLSCSMDCNVKIWDGLNQRRCMRSYMGHDQGVRDIKFTNDGRRFYSCSYDRNIILWDTEYGKIINKFTNGKTPFCVTVHPHDDQQNIIIVGSQNKKAVQFDADSGQIVQEYTEHLGPVNTVTFCEDGKKIVTTADDKKMFIWDYGIPVVVKVIAVL